MPPKSAKGPKREWNVMRRTLLCCWERELRTNGRWEQAISPGNAKRSAPARLVLSFQKREARTDLTTRRDCMRSNQGACPAGSGTRLAGDPRRAPAAKSFRGAGARSHPGVIVDGDGSRAVYASNARPGVDAAWPLYGGQGLGVAPFMNFCVTIGESKSTSAIMIRSRCRSEERREGNEG